MVAIWTSRSPAVGANAEPLLGVYECRYHNNNAPGSTFALLDRANYRDYDGNRGSYRYDLAAKEILFQTGPKKGYRARLVERDTFHIIDLDGTGTGNYCPYNEYRDPNAKRLFGNKPK